MLGSSEEPLSNEINWHYLQIKGDMGQDQPKEEDIVSSVVFNHDGEFLVTGDRGGRIVIFQRDQKNMKGNRDYNCYISFQSHEPKFDYLKSLEIDEGIVQIKWLKPLCDSLLLLTTNTKTIKLWKISQRMVLDHHTDDACEDESVNDRQQNRKSNDSSTSVNLGSGHVRERLIRDCISKKVYDNAHAYTINSISVSTDHENFISTDDLRIYLWNLDSTGVCFKIVDIKPEVMEDLRDVITCSAFHPIHNSLMVYGVSRGMLNMCDLRERAVFNQPTLTYENYYAPGSVHYEIQETLNDMMNSFSDVRYSSDGMLLMARDYLGVRIWDQRMTVRPLEVYPVQSFLRPLIDPICENHLFMNRFDSAWSPDNKSILTGSYSDVFSIIPRKISHSSSLSNNSGTMNDNGKRRHSFVSSHNYANIVIPSVDNMTEFHNYYYQATLQDFCVRSSCRISAPIHRKVIVISEDDSADYQMTDNSFQSTETESSFSQNGTEDEISKISQKLSDFSMDDRINLNHLDLDRKIGSCDWHPSENIISLAVHNNLFLLHQKN